jgi:hypothetical protein
MILAIFRIAGYSIVFVAQIIWFLGHGRSDKIGDAMDGMGKAWSIPRQTSSEGDGSEKRAPAASRPTAI